MTRTKLLLAVLVSQSAGGKLLVQAESSSELRLNPQLDADVSMQVQAALAKASPAFAAELEATTHFVERLSDITDRLADGVEIPDTPEGATSGWCTKCGKDHPASPEAHPHLSTREAIARMATNYDEFVTESISILQPGDTIVEKWWHHDHWLVKVRRPHA